MVWISLLIGIDSQLSLHEICKQILKKVVFDRLDIQQGKKYKTLHFLIAFGHVLRSKCLEYFEILSHTISLKLKCLKYFFILTMLSLFCNQLEKFIFRFQKMIYSSVRINKDINIKYVLDIVLDFWMSTYNIAFASMLPTFGLLSNKVSILRI